MKFTMALKYALHYKVPLQVFQYYFKFQHIDPEDWVVKVTRGFPATDNFLEKFRIRPNAVLMRNLYERLSIYTNEYHERKIRNYVSYHTELTKNGIFVPGCASSNRSYWLAVCCVSNKS
jgi:hypothetical protein